MNLILSIILFTLPILQSAFAQGFQPALRQDRARQCAQTTASGECGRFSDESVQEAAARWSCLNGSGDACSDYQSFRRNAATRPLAPPVPVQGARTPNPVAPPQVVGLGLPTDPRNAAAAVGFRLDGRTHRMSNATIHYGTMPTEGGRTELPGVIIDHHDARVLDDKFYVVVATGSQSEKFDDARTVCTGGVGKDFDLPLFSRRFQLMGVPNFSSPVGEMTDPRGIRNQFHALWLRLDVESQTRSELRGTSKAFIATLPMNNPNFLHGKVMELSRLGAGGITLIDGVIVATQGGRAQEDAVINTNVQILNHRRGNLPRNFDLYFSFENDPEEAIRQNPGLTEEQKKTARDIMASVGSFMGQYPNHANALRRIFRANLQNRDARHEAMNNYVNGPMATVWFEIFNRNTGWMLAASSVYPQIQPLMRIIQQPNSGQPKIYCAREIAKR